MSIVAKRSPISATVELLLLSLALHQISRLSTVTVAFDVEQRSLTLSPVLPKPEVVFSGQRAADKTIYGIKVE